MFELKSNESYPLIRPALYVIATPIGQLADISLRALQILAEVDHIAAEDTRHSDRLLRHYNIQTPVFALHEHNEDQRLDKIVALLDQGKTVALISDAGTPLIHDPGYKLVRYLRERCYRVIPVPGASAVIAALSVAGLPTDRFTFIGFLPNRSPARIASLKTLYSARETLIFFEAPHRIKACIDDFQAVFGLERKAVLAKELTKPYETIRYGTFPELAAWLAEDPLHEKGEFVLLVHGNTEPDRPEQETAMHDLLLATLKEVPLKTAVKIVSTYTGINKNQVYQYALTLC